MINTYSEPIGHGAMKRLNPKAPDVAEEIPAVRFSSDDLSVVGFSRMQAENVGALIITGPDISGLSNQRVGLMMITAQRILHGI
jgi:hypothetical protein